MPSVEQMGRPAVHLGELTFDHTANRSHGLYVRSNSGYELFYYAENKRVPVEIPEKARVSNPAWSPDGTQLAFFCHTFDATHIYLADTKTGKSRKLTTTPVLATMVTGFQWSNDGRKIQTVILPDDGKRQSHYGDPAKSPRVRVADPSPKVQNARTYRYLLETVADMELLEHLLIGQLAVIDVTSGKVTKVGAPTMISSVSASLGMESFRVGTMKKEFSYYQPATSVPKSESIWDVEGKNVYSFPGKGKGGKGKKADDPPDPVDPDQKKAVKEPAEDPEGKRELSSASRWRRHALPAA